VVKKAGPTVGRRFYVCARAQEDNSKYGPEFTLLPDEVLGKLTRQTQKKMERETNNKRKNEVAEDDDTDEKTTRKSRKLGTCTLLVRGSDKGVNSANGRQLSLQKIE
ncbi:hypothetical protein Tco_1453043, partial [Tanacetum coccineum]